MIQTLSQELSTITGQNIMADYIQPKTRESRFRKDSMVIRPGYPMIKNFTHALFGVDIHPDDFNKIQSGEISVQDYILQSTWIIKYNSAMKHRTYSYQTSHLIEQQEEIRRDLKIWLCSSLTLSYFPKVNKCNACPVKPCPVSPYRLIWTGTMYWYVDTNTGKY